MSRNIQKISQHLCTTLEAETYVPSGSGLNAVSEWPKVAWRVETTTSLLCLKVIVT